MKSFCSSHIQYGMPQWVRLFHILFYGMCISICACSRDLIKNNHCYEPYESALASIINSQRVCESFNNGQFIEKYQVSNKLISYKPEFSEIEGFEDLRSQCGLDIVNDKGVYSYDSIVTCGDLPLALHSSDSSQVFIAFSNIYYLSKCRVFFAVIYQGSSSYLELGVSDFSLSRQMWAVFYYDEHNQLIETRIGESSE